MSEARRLPFLDALTERESDVLRLMANGRSNREIAHELSVSYETAKWYTKQIFNKLGIEGAGQKRDRAVASARALGLLEAERTPGGRLRYNMPAPTTPLVGRRRELDDVVALLADPNVRLVTLLGPGGMGKTRLALEIAWQLVGPEANGLMSALFPDGVYFAALQPLDSAESIPFAVAEAVDYPFQSAGGEPLQHLLQFFREKRLLLVLDNFEHLLEGAVLVSDILGAAPGVQVLVTSREGLNLTGETVYSLEGLAVPGYKPTGNLGDYDAARLFVQGARRANAGFELQPDEHEALARICSLVQGMPLAILLAAAWVEVLSLPEIADEIARGFDFLAAEMRDAPPRQRSIRAVFEPTWQRLSAEEQAVFMRLAVFRGGCTRQAAAAVTGTDLPTLQSLVNKAILSRTPQGRYEIHELLRQYAQECLDAAGETGVVRDAHCAYYAQFVGARDEDLKGGHRQRTALDEIDAEFENVRAAWNWAVERRNVAMLAEMEWGLWRFLLISYRLVLGLTLFKEVFDLEEDRALAGRMMGRYAGFCGEIGRNHEAEKWAHQSLAIARELDQPIGLAYALRQAAIQSATTRRDFDHAHELIDESLALFRTIGDAWGLAWALHGKGYVCAHELDWSSAVAFTEEGLEYARTIGDRRRMATALLNIGTFLSGLGRPQAAMPCLEESLALSQELRIFGGMAMAVGQMGVCAQHQGDFDTAHACYDKAVALGREYSHPRVIAYYSLLTADVLSLSGLRESAAQCLADCSRLLQALEDALLEAWVPSLQAMFAYRTGNDSEALRWAQQGVEFARQRQVGLYVSQSLLLMGLVEIRLGRLDAAQQRLRSVIPDVRDRPQLMRAIYGIAALAAGMNQLERATELGALVESHGTAEYEFKVYARALMAELKALLAPEMYDAAVERGVSLDPDEVVAAWLQENALHDPT